MSNFRIGDKVKYAVSGALDWESEDWATIIGLVVGEIYTIYSTDEDAVMLVEDDGDEDADGKFILHQGHFELVRD
jgi:hypothetical protein